MATNQMIKEPLVSVVTPCYNGEKFLKEYFESLFQQTYTNFEVILVNDGSTDNTDNLVNLYRKQIEDKGINFQYVVKNNEGQMKAVQDGMLLANGDFLTWPDIDDIMESTYLEDKVNVFLDNPDADIVISPSNIYAFTDKEKIIGVAWKKEFYSQEELITRFIEDKDAGYMPGSFMLRSTSFLKLYPDKVFYSELKAGVAIPLVFPFIFSGKAIYLDKPLYRYFVHVNNQHTVNELRDINNLEVLYDNVIQSMELQEDILVKLKKRIHIRCLQLKLGYAYRSKNKMEFKRIKRELLDEKGFRCKDRVKELLLLIGFAG